MSDQEMTTGVVKFFNATKGFGFITPENGANDDFVHISALQRCGLDGLREGDKVQYTTSVNTRTGKSSVDQISKV